uniref:Putative 115 kDa protein in type-1 retrotransposable element R1DM n=1 Tax=Ceratitis capitata TaxID=7213 RepID=W8ADE4_CERCA
MIRCVQINLNHCEAAQDLLKQTIFERKIDVALISEQYRSPTGEGSWLQDKRGKAAIWACGDVPFEQIGSSQHEGFTHAKIGRVHFYSCYAPPSEPLEGFKNMLMRLVSDAAGKSPVIIAGDFNAWAVEWGSSKTTARGQALLEAFINLDIVVLNQGRKNTYQKGNAGSIIDLTFCSAALLDLIKWEILDDFTYSDHFAISFVVHPPRSIAKKNRVPKVQKSGWKTKMLDSSMLSYMTDLLPDLFTVGTYVNADKCANVLMNHITEICDASMPRKTRGNGRAPVYWWNQEIKELRAQSLKLRRQYQRQRARSNPEYLRLQLLYRSKRDELQKAIKKSKREAFQELIRDVDDNPWGSGYNVVLKKLKGSNAKQPVCPQIMKHIVEGLFPKHDEYIVPNETAVDVAEIPPVSNAEVLAAVARIKSNKSPGVDGVPNVVLMYVAKKRPELFSKLFTKCVQEGIFPKRWKRQRLVLLPKGKMPPEEPSAHRPLCMLDTAGKLLEAILSSRIQEITEGDHGLSTWQYGFRRKRSTIDSIAAVCDIARKALEGKRWFEGTKQYCAIITLDVKNAFNSANWQQIITATRNMNVPDYLIRVIRSYFSERVLLYDTNEGPMKYKITAGVPQGSVLGPLLWNIMYDGIFKVRKPEGVSIVGYADDIAIVVVAKQLSDATRRCNETIASVKAWLLAAKLELADHKTEALLMTSRKKVEAIQVRVGGCIIESRPTIKYLGVILDRRLSFKEHLKYASGKAGKIGAAVARLMPNIRGPRQQRRKLLASISSSILMYAAPIWADATLVPAYLRAPAAVHRLASLRVCSAFVTVSDEAANLLAGRWPVDIAARAASEVRHNPTKRKEVMQQCINEWQQRWDSSSKGRWTKKLIPNVSKWIERQHGETDYYLTQFLTGHGCFRQYLHKYTHADTPYCLHCSGETEDAEHILLYCSRFENERKQLIQCIRGTLTPESLLEAMILKKCTWNRCAEIIVEIMKRLRVDDHRSRRLM